jgi:bifunctional DNase/RNase
MIEVVVSRLGLDSSTQSYVVILQEKDGQRLLPIWIGQPEAESIVMQMHNIKRPRPLTHDLCKSLIVGLGGALQKVHITRVEKNTYYAELHIARNGGGDVVQVDARPSDSIAIALRLSAPIFASESLLSNVEVEESGESFDAEQVRSESELNAEQLKEYLERLRPEDFGKFNL